MENPDNEVIGEISEEIAKQIKRQAGKIVLQEGNELFGKNHILLKHQSEILGLGYACVEDFVKEVAQEYSQIWEGKKASLILNKPDKLAKLIIVKLQEGQTEDVYSVQTAGAFRTSYLGRLKKLLWENSELSTTKPEN